MKKLLLILIALPMIGFGQTWERFYGDNNIADEYGYCVRQTTDGGYIVTGFESSSGSLGSGTNMANVWLIKTDINGDTIWTKKFRGAAVNGGYSVQQTTDGGYIISGYTEDLGVNGDVLLIKTDGNGQIQWLKNFGGNGSDYGYSVQQTTDGGFIISSGMYLIKTDANGDSIWTKTGVYGNSVQQTTDGGFIISNGMYLIKTDTNGDSIWTKTGVYGNSVQQTNDGGYIVAGGASTTTNNPFGTPNGEVYLIKTDSNGDSIWTKKFGGIGDDIGYCVQQTTDGGYIICGGKQVQENNGAFSDVYLLKTDASGNEQWSKTFGSDYADVGRFVQQTSDGGYIITGNFWGDIDQNEIYLIKTDGNGNVTSTFNIPINPNRKLQKTVDILGRETNQTNQPLFYIYDDGTVEKRIVIE